VAVQPGDAAVNAVDTDAILMRQWKECATSIGTIGRILVHVVV